MTQELSKQPTVDVAEHNAFFPSAYSLSQFTAPMSDLSDFHYDKKYTGNKKILLIASDERYLLMDNGTFFSTGNHPVETLVPMYHLVEAGWDFEIVTLSGNPVKFEFWAMPSEDTRLKEFFERYAEQFKAPKKLANVIADGLDQYFALYIPGGHGALVGLDESLDVKAALEHFHKKNEFIITICHGPAGLLAAALNEDKDNFLFKGYELVLLPDVIDRTSPDMGYMPGHLRWYMGTRLEELGMKVLNEGIDGSVHRDRNLLSGDSPLAANNLGKLAAKALLETI